MVFDPQSLYGVVLASGFGTRLWPLPRRDRSKLLIDLLGGGRPLVRQAADRVAELIPPGLVGGARRCCAGCRPARRRGRCRSGTPAWAERGVPGLRRLPRVQGVAVGSSAVAGGAVGVSIDGAGTTVFDVSVTGARICLRIGGDGENAVVTAVRMAGTETGLQANAGAGGVAVGQLQVAQRGGQGIRSAAKRISVDDSTVEGAQHGMHLQGEETVRASTVSGAGEAVVAGPRRRLMFVGGALHGESFGLRVSVSSWVVRRVGECHSDHAVSVSPHVTNMA